MNLLLCPNDGIDGIGLSTGPQISLFMGVWPGTIGDATLSYCGGKEIGDYQLNRDQRKWLPGY
ncbi:MAG: hypothetical protein R2788_21725 [Saprospiraceae bacterium]